MTRTMHMLLVLVTSGPSFCLIALISQISPVAPTILQKLALVPRLMGYVVVVLAVTSSLPLWSQRQWAPRAFWATWCAAFGLTLVAFTLLLPYHPCVAVAVLAGLGPALLYPVRYLIYSDIGAAKWFRVACHAASFAAVVCLIAWSAWVAANFHRHESWTKWPKSIGGLVAKHTITWKVAFVAWVLPLACAGEMGLTALLCWIRARHLDEIATHGQEGGFLMQAVKHTAVWLMGLMMLVWIGASINATGELQFNQEKDDMRMEAVGVATWALAALALWVLDMVGPSAVMNPMMQSKVVLEANRLMQQDWPRAFIFLLTAFPMSICMAVDALCFLARPSLREAEKPDRLLRFATEWRWSSVVVKAQVLGIAVVACVVGIAKLTTVFLVIVNEHLSGWPTFSVSVVMFLIAFALFMCPASPGPPIYMVMSIVIVSSALRQGWGFEVALAWATFVAFAMKMAFTAVAQKCIGERLSANDDVRRCIGIHTPYMRAIEQILTEPGLTLAKVAVLVGGPDWPVAVLCGLLRLSVLQIQLGISPVLVQSVFPCVLSGALLLTEGKRGSEEGEGHGLAEISLVVAAFLQIGFGIVAFYCVTEVLERDYERLAVPRPEDACIAELEVRAEAQDRAFWREAAWDLLPWPIKLTLIVGFICMEGCLLLLAGPWDAVIGMPCFKPFDLMSSIQRDLGGHVLAIIEPLGWAALALGLISTASVTVFYMWAGVHVRSVKLVEEGQRIL